MRCQKGPSAEFNGRPAKKQARLDAGLGKLAVGWPALERRLAGRSELTRCGGGEKKARCGVETNERRFSLLPGDGSAWRLFRLQLRVLYVCYRL